MNKTFLIFKTLGREISEQKKTFVLFCLNLVLGFAGFLLLQVFQDSLQLQTQSRAQDLLSADFAVSARRKITESEILNIEKIIDPYVAKKSQTVELFAMIKGEEKTRLVRVKAIDNLYPLYGKITFTNNSKHDEVLKNGLSQQVILDSEITKALKFKNNKITLGDKEFSISGTLVEDTSRGLGFSGLAPFVYISVADLKDTTLIQEGSTFTQYYFYTFKKNIDYQKIKNELNAKILDPTLQLNFVDDEEGQNNQVLKYFNDYLGLVSLVSIGLSFLCLVYLLNWLYQRQKKTLATYVLLGFSSLQVIAIQALKIFLTSLMAFLFSFFLLVVLNPFFEKLLVDTFNFSLHLDYFNLNFIKIIVVIFIGPQLMSFLNYYEIYKINPL